MSFTSLGVVPELVAKLQEMNIVEPQPIQKIVIPVALRNQSVLVTSQTGSGKTLSYLLPLFQLLTHTNSAGVKALILAPTRELAQQIGGVCGLLCEAIPIKYSVIVGGVDYKSQREELSAHPDVVVATPGRLLDLMEQGVVSLSDLRFFVLDEVDQMLDLGFRESIIALSQSRAESAATLCFSATLPDDVEDMVALLEPSIERLTVGGQSMSVESVDHLGYFVSFEMMDSLLLHLLKTEAAEQSIIFTRSRKMADRVVAVLSSNAIAAEAMHSDRSQAAREHTLARFRSGETTIIVATDVMARGIDIESVTHVFNFGLPQSPEQYIHRCGRCGRAGRSGRAISIFTPEERPILDSICKLMKRHIVLDHAHPYMTPDVSRALNGTQRGAKRKKR